MSNLVTDDERLHVSFDELLQIIKQTQLRIQLMQNEQICIKIKIQAMKKKHVEIQKQIQQEQVELKIFRNHLQSYSNILKKNPAEKSASFFFERLNKDLVNRAIRISNYILSMQQKTYTPVKYL
ncbi:hypothetical protein BMW23_1100 [Bodo saltans virus]|uniref:Uncharacterized protein n=1 Tax=Bodo saltans virus TaxID=2024608 RepID=A0A2H4UW72_9VIRU|nr:hypothetical protein QJ851_gp1081 [Bodo saltans virus]ATZ81144.1 hypothetical protein BMW23_1100 [Bodo saltans virus]